VAREIDVFSPAGLAGIMVNRENQRSATDEGMADENGNPTANFPSIWHQ
jgi:hypothetical protein